MDESSFQVLSPSPIGYEEALKKVWEELRRQTDDGIVRRKAVERIGERRIELPFLRDAYTVDIASESVMDASGKEVFPFLKVLLLHYLAGLSAERAGEDWLSFRQLRGGATYYPAFAARTVFRLKDEFGGREERFREAAETLGGQPLNFKDISFAFDVFPRIRIAVIIHCATEEFDAEANILFDKAAAAHLETEDLAVCGAMLVSKIVKTAKNLRSGYE